MMRSKPEVHGFNRWCIKEHGRADEVNYLVMFEIINIVPGGRVRMRCTWSGKPGLSGYQEGSEHYSANINDLKHYKKATIIGLPQGYWYPVDDIEYILFQLRDER